MMADSRGRLSRVLVGSDLSAESDTVLRNAALLAGANDAELHVVSAYADADRGRSPSDMPPAERAEVSDALPAQIRRVLETPGQAASQTVRIGAVAEVILERAHEVRADLIVLGEHHGTDVNASFLGTTADAVLRDSSVACLISADGMSLPFQKIALAVDLTDNAANTIRRAARILGGIVRGGPRDDSRSQVTVLHVVPANPESASVDARQQLEPLVADLARESELEGSLTIEGRVIAAPEPAHAILEWARREGVDLLVVGTRDRPRVQGSQIGSVSSTVARRAKCTVLMIPPGD